MDQDWKKSLGFPVNYNSQSSDDDFDTSDVVMRHPRHSSGFLLADGGDGSEADLLGTTPPRSRIRDKEKRRNVLESHVNAQKSPKTRRPVVDDDGNYGQSPPLVRLLNSISDRLKRRSNLKLVRARARDWKQDQGQREHRADSLPSPNPTTVVPTLVESCNRFMSLTSRLKCPEGLKDEDLVEQRVRDGKEELPANRVNFHKTFCMLINMGNIEKGCRRTISREEQVWQNELKDLIWLELQATIAGRSLAEQDEFLCSQRNVVPIIVQNIIDYRFVNTDACKYHSRPLCFEGSKEDLTADPAHDDNNTQNGATTEYNDESSGWGCVSFNCVACTQAIARAMRELGTLLDSFYNALSLYPSSKAMTLHHPLIATQLFKNRLKVLLLGYLLDSFYNALSLYPSSKAMTLHHPLIATQLFKNRLKVLLLGYLLDSFYNALSLYPSSKAMTLHHPLIATQLFKNRLKAMCLWYNVALHMHLKVASVRRMLRSMTARHSSCPDTRRTSDSHKPSQVRFNLSDNPTDSSNSDSSTQSEVIKEEAGEEAKELNVETPECQRNESQETESHAHEEPSEEADTKQGSVESQGGSMEKIAPFSEDEVDRGIDWYSESNGQITPELVISGQAGPPSAASSESGYASASAACSPGELAELARLRLLGRCQVSPYRCVPPRPPPPAPRTGGTSASAACSPGELAELARLRLLGRCQVSPYRCVPPRPPPPAPRTGGTSASAACSPGELAELARLRLLGRCQVSPYRCVPPPPRPPPPAPGARVALPVRAAPPPAPRPPPRGHVRERGVLPGRAGRAGAAAAARPLPGVALQVRAPRPPPPAPRTGGTSASAACSPGELAELARLRLLGRCQVSPYRCVPPRPRPPPPRTGGTSASAACSPGELAELARLRLLGRCQVSPYRAYHHEMLKTQSVRRCMSFMDKLRKHVLAKVYLTLEKPDHNASETHLDGEDAPTGVFDESKHEEETDAAGDKEAMVNELHRYGCWSEECLAMRLPSYRNYFLLLSSICLEAVHDYLTMRLEDRPEKPSCLTIKQLIHELKEGLDIATEARADFVRNVRVALAGRAGGAGGAGAAGAAGGAEGAGGGASPVGACGAARADLLLLVRTYDATVEEVMRQYLSYLTTMSETMQLTRAQLQAEWDFMAQLARRVHCAALLAPAAHTNITCNQLDRVLQQFRSKFSNMKETMNHIDYKSKIASVPVREAVYALCRETQATYASERDALLQAVQAARALALRLARAAPFPRERDRIFEKLMSIREFIVRHTDMVLEKSRSVDEERTAELHEGLVARVREMLLQMFKLGFEIHRELYSFVNAPGVRSSFACSRRSLLNSPPRRYKLARSESVNDEFEASVFDDRLFDNLNPENLNSIERLLSGDEPAEERGPEKPDAADRPDGPDGPDAPDGVQRRWAATVARAVIQFAKCWMHFVVQRCDRGRGLRPRWASQGLDFLTLACDPCITKHLSEEEFKELETLMDGCISHVVGSRPAPAPARPAPPRAPRARRPRPQPPAGSPRGVPAPPAPPLEPAPLLSFRGLEPAGMRRRVCGALSAVERARSSRLSARGAVGRVVEARAPGLQRALRHVTFKWQRGLKIGAGTFGKVYTVVNTESGQLLAMKELSIGAGDRRAIQRAANELRVLEGVVHPHLVRYYGCELHREEMLLFMELCVEGSLETLVAGSGPLPELTVRRYTRQLLSAVIELHARTIAHRDIKSGNIFLTHEGHCLKLGDFGCAVKIRAHTTAPGELQGYIGTQAYMAPEVFMKSTGHGRAADVWSVGCVVTEMASGKRPFSESDSNYQIMFVVGMGGRPAVPESLSAEGQNFCMSCLTHDPDHRPRAEELTMHHFLMSNADNDCKCEPAYLI
ncbi:uncharacterized protein LOC131848650 [Achroia grisella]|uniref:uncharacterized protein LOC131848650 n=1 Tax=Achroia grisella TaxID=688607 RepID=UPI0027D29823|nr:uncharacterized protein LOC131848650 [Achroia grisella]